MILKSSWKKEKKFKRKDKVPKRIEIVNKRRNKVHKINEKVPEGKVPQERSEKESSQNKKFPK